MSFKDLKKDETASTDEKDSLGGFQVLDAGLYEFKIEAAYSMKSTGGALGLVLHLKDDANHQLRQTIWVTSGDKKGNSTTYKDKDGKNQYLPGFLQASSLVKVVLNDPTKDITDLDSEEKVMKIYSFDAKAEIPTKVDMFMDLVGQKVLCGVLQDKVDKNQKMDDGSYQPTGETRMQNEIDKFFNIDSKKSSSEIKDKIDPAQFHASWEKKNKGQVRDKSTAGAGGNADTAGAPGGAKKAAVPGASGKPTNSLFG